MPIVARPDGSLRDTVRRVAVYHNPREIRCPACSASVSRFTARPGEAFLTCENRRFDLATRRKSICGQHMYVLTTPARLIAVVPVTMAEYEQTCNCDDKAARELHNLGILPAAYGALAAARVA